MFTLTLSAAYGQPVTVGYRTADFSATAGSDYQPASGTLTFAPGETTKTVTVLVNGDRVGEPNEYFLFNLGSPPTPSFADGQGEGTIVDDDTLPQVRISDVTKSEGSGGNTLFTFTVTLSAPDDQAGDGPLRHGRRHGDDRGGLHGRVRHLTFAPGETSKTITIVVKGDKQEGGERDVLPEPQRSHRGGHPGRPGTGHDPQR